MRNLIVGVCVKYVGAEQSVYTKERFLKAHATRPRQWWVAQQAIRPTRLLWIDSPANLPVFSR